MRALIKAGIRFTVAFMFLESVPSWVNTFVVMSRGGYYASARGGLPEILVPSASVALMVAFLAVIWWRADWVVSRLAGEADDIAIVITTSNLDLFGVATRLLGMVLIAQSVPDLLGQVAVSFVFSSLPPGVDLAGPMAGEQTRRTAIAIATLLVGIWLVLRKEGLLAALGRVWNNPSPSGDKPDRNG